MNIAVTGEGILSSIGKGKTQTTESLLQHRSGIGQMSQLPSTHHELPVGEVKLSNSEMKSILGIDEHEEVSRTTLMAIIAIKEALDDANLSIDELNGKRIALVSGTTVGGMDITEQHFLQNNLDGDLSFLNQHDCGGCTKSIADYFGIFSSIITISTACSSAANAIMVGADMLKAGEVDLVVAGGSEALSIFHLNGFNSLMILDHEPCRPFDAERAGLNLGEGAAYIVLEATISAEKRNATPHAYVAGYGNACDAFHQTASSDNGEGAFLAMQDALTMAGLDASEIQYVNAHGTGTPNNDQSETVAIKRMFGDNLPPISSTKGFTGHTTSASGSIEAVICLLAMQHGFIPANQGWNKQMENGITPTMGVDNIELNNVLCNSFGFGGNDSAIVFSKTVVNDEVNATISDDRIKEIARVKLDSAEQLAEIRNFVKPMEARRMGPLMKASLLTSIKALQNTGISMPDAIVTGTAYGCIANSEQILRQLVEQGEEMVKPTLFMQSTHNTISSNIAIKLGCHGYNITFTQGDQSLECAVAEAKRLLKSGRCKTVLVGCHDESTPLFSDLMTLATGKTPATIHSLSIVLSCTE